MKERLVDILAITIPVNEDGSLRQGSVHWNRGWMHPKTKYEMLQCPPGVGMTNIPMQLEGYGVGVPIGLVDVYELYDTAIHGLIFRSPDERKI